MLIILSDYAQSSLYDSMSIKFVREILPDSSELIRSNYQAHLSICKKNTLNKINMETESNATNREMVYAARLGMKLPCSFGSPVFSN